MEVYFEYLQQYISLSSTLKTRLEELTKTETLEKGHQLLKDGAVCHRLYFVKKGVLRTFYYLDGKDITSWFYAENTMLTSWQSFLFHQPFYEYIEVLEKATVVSLTYEELNALYNEFPAFERFGRKLAETQLAYIDLYSKGFMFLSAKQRYDMLQEYFPDVMMRVNLGHIASMLGISQETLSRIRKKK